MLPRHPREARQRTDLLHRTDARVVDLDDVAVVADLRVVHELLRRHERPVGRIVLVEDLEPLGEGCAGVRRVDQCQQLRSLGAVGTEVLVDAQRLHHVLEDPSCGTPGLDPLAVGATGDPVPGHLVVGVAALDLAQQGLGLGALGPDAGVGVHEVRAQERRADRLAEAGHLTGLERGEGADQRQHRGAEAALGDGVVDRTTGAVAVLDGVLAGGGGDDALVGLGVGIGARRSEPRDRHVDQAWCQRAQVLVIDAEAGRRRRPEALDQHVARLCQLDRSGAIAGVAEVEHDPSFATVPLEERWCVPPELTLRGLDLHDVGAVVGEDHAGDGAVALSEVQDAEAGAGERRSVLSHVRPHHLVGRLTRLSSDPRRHDRLTGSVAMGVSWRPVPSGAGPPTRPW